MIFVYQVHQRPLAEVAGVKLENLRPFGAVVIDGVPWVLLEELVELRQGAAPSAPAANTCRGCAHFAGEYLVKGRQVGTCAAHQASTTEDRSCDQFAPRG